MLHIVAILVLGVFFSCHKKKTETPPDVGYDYYPTTLGKYIIYNVDSTIYDDFKHDTVYYHYQIKEKLEEQYTDNEGRAAIRMVRYIKKYNPNVPYSAMSWTIKDVWEVNKTQTTAEVVEENVRFVKLAFPVKQDASWNGNARNTNPEWDYQYNYINNKETINGTTFDNVLYVEQKDDKEINQIHREYYIEKYAKGVGLVYREIKDLYSDLSPIPVGVKVEDRIVRGVKYKLTYVTHGYE
ncbi:MAG: hypothetical protein JST26_01740 [Bacteroidetes bacterium]|nr:hypothetical protein [Bacteroidota bacterium]